MLVMLVMIAISHLFQSQMYRSDNNDNNTHLHSQQNAFYSHHHHHHCNNQQSQQMMSGHNNIQNDADEKQITHKPESDINCYVHSYKVR